MKLINLDDNVTVASVAKVREDKSLLSPEELEARETEESEEVQEALDHEEKENNEIIN